MRLWHRLKYWFLKLINKSPKKNISEKPLIILNELQTLKSLNNENTINFIFEFMQKEEITERAVSIWEETDWRGARIMQFTPMSFNWFHSQLSRVIEELDNPRDLEYFAFTKQMYDILLESINNAVQYCFNQVQKELLYKNYIRRIEVMNNSTGGKKIVITAKSSWYGKKINSALFDNFKADSIKYLRNELQNIREYQSVKEVIELFPYSNVLYDTITHTITNLEKLNAEFPYQANQFSNKYSSTVYNINSVFQSEIKELNEISEYNEELIIRLMSSIEKESEELLCNLTNKKSKIEKELREAGVKSRSNILKLEQEYLEKTKSIPNETLDTATIVKEILNQDIEKER